MRPAGHVPLRCSCERESSCARRATSSRRGPPRGILDDFISVGRDGHSTDPTDRIFEGEANGTCRSLEAAPRTSHRKRRRDAAGHPPISDSRSVASIITCYLSGESMPALCNPNQILSSCICPGGGGEGTRTLEPPDCQVAQYRRWSCRIVSCRRILARPGGRPVGRLGRRATVCDAAGRVCWLECWLFVDY